MPNFIVNNFFNDAFFLKGLVSNGVCPSYCPNEPAFPDPKPYGVNYPGATFKFTVLDTAGNKRAHMGKFVTLSNRCRSSNGLLLNNCSCTIAAIVLFAATNALLSDRFGPYQQLH